MKRFEQNYLLDRSGVDTVSEKVSAYLTKAGIKRENATRLRLTMEELLLNICEHFDEAMEGQLVIGSRFGTPYLRFRYAGERYDPVPSEASPSAELTRQILSNLGLTPTWSYRNGVNEIYLRGPHQTLSSELVLTGAVMLAVLAGLSGGLLPSSVTQAVSDYALTPLSDAFMNMLNTFVGVMVFLSVVTGICSIGNISDFSKMGKYVIGRMLGFTLLGTGLGIALMIPLFRFGEGVAVGRGMQTGAVIDLLFSIIPSDPVTPFAEGNMTQVIFIAVLTGCALLVLESMTTLVRSLVEQLNALVTHIIQGVCKLLPVYIFTSLLAMIWENGAGIFLRLWKPLLIYAAAALLLFAGKLGIACLKLRLRPGRVISCIKRTMLIGLTTSSSAVAFGTMLDVNEHELGISPELSRFGTPLGNQLVGSLHGVLLAAIVYYLAEYYAVPVDFGWFFTAWLMCFIFSVTIPPVSGGTLVVTGMLMSQLAIPQGGLAVAGFLGIIMDFAATAARIGVIHLELLLDAGDLHLWKREILNGDK